MLYATKVRTFLKVDTFLKTNSNNQEYPIYQHQQKTMLDLSAQERVKQLWLCLFDGNQVLDKQGGEQPEQVGIPCRVVQNEVNGKADERPTDEQAMVDERLFQPHLHHEAVLARGAVVLHIAHIVDVEHGIGEETHRRGGQEDAKVK